MRRQAQEHAVFDTNEASGEDTGTVQEGTVLEAAGFLNAGVDAEAGVDDLCRC